MYFTATKNKFIFCILLFLCSNFITAKTIKIQYETEFPSMDLQIGSKKFRFLLDTGSAKSLIYFNVIKELEIDKTVFFYDFMEFKIADELIDDVNDQIKKMNRTFAVADNSVLKRMPAIYFDFDNLRINNTPVETVRFYFYRNINKYITSTLDVDGILGMNFLSNFKNLTIDYPNKIIYLNSKKCNIKNKVPIAKNDDIENLGLTDNLLYLDLQIENVYHTFTLDTGGLAEFILISPQSDSELNEAKINANDDVSNPTYFYKSIRIGNKMFENIRTCYTSFPGLITVLQDNGKWEENKINCLGQELFKKHIIQFDFENNTFGIE
ncbi:MAG: hypothetical protein K6G09_02595 [Treponema sp.]|nr:hypothetical protein [Treponema sp.]